jgi:hypothetical protein
MTVGLDPYLKVLIRTQVTVDAASRVFLKDKEMTVHTIGGVRKIQLPNTKFLISLDDLVAVGCKVLGARTPRTLALYGAEARWAEQRKNREEAGLPINVYVANARSIQYAIDNGRAPPITRYIGRRQNKMTEVYDTIEEVVTAMNEARWRETFSKGRYRRKS